MAFPTVRPSLANQVLQVRPKALLENVESLLFERINQERIQRGLQPLASEPILVTIARSHSVDMLERDYVDHTNPEGKGPLRRVGEHHRRLVGEVAENVWSAIRSEDSGPSELATHIMDALMASDGHRRNILAPNLTHLGLGVYSADGRAVGTREYRVTQLFAAIESYTDQPVAETLSRTSFVYFSLKRPDGGRSGVEYFELWSDQEQRVVFGPVEILRAKIDADPGTYQLRFYFRLEPGKLAVYSGPYVVVE